jgi:hypothetical protein
MKKATLIVATLAALTTLSLFGCGGGGTPDANPTPTPSPSPTPGSGGNFALLVGSGDAATLTARTWKDISIKPNGVYYVSSAEVACPARVALKDGSDVVSCDPDEPTQYRSDGRVGYLDGTGKFSYGTTDSLSVSGSEVTFNYTGSDPTAVKRTVFSILSTETVAGKLRIRLREIDRTLGSGATDPTDIGSEVVIEEVTF